MAEVQLPRGVENPLPLSTVIKDSMTAPELNRIVEKLAASIAALPSASRQSTEFEAKATSATPVQVNVLKRLNWLFIFSKVEGANLTNSNHLRAPSEPRCREMRKPTI